ncbi:MAG: SPOR domain-containing protein [Candidatus Eisenbacteria bacterium]
MSDIFRLHDGPPPQALSEARDAGLIEGAVMLQTAGELPELAVVRPLVEEPGASWTGWLAGLMRPGTRTLLGVVSHDARLAASVACDLASWWGDRDRDTVVVDGSLESPSVDKPLREDGDEGFVDAVLFGVSPSAVARRTLAAGVRVVTAGSHPLSVAKALDPGRLSEFAASLAADVTLLVVPSVNLELVASALDAVVLVGGDAGALLSGARRARDAGVTAITLALIAPGGARAGIAAETPAPIEPEPLVDHDEGDGREPSGPDEGRELPSVDDRGELPPVDDSRELPPVDDRGELPPIDDRGELPPVDDRGELPPIDEGPEPPEPDDSPFLPEGGTVVTAAARVGTRPRRAGRSGVVAVLVVLVAAAGWFLFRPGGLLNEQPLERPGTRTTPSSAEPDARTSADGVAAEPDAPTSRDGVAAEADAPTSREDVPAEVGTATQEEDDVASPVLERPDVIAGGDGPYVIYLSSHRYRSAAELDRGDAGASGIDAVIIEAELPESGTWYRVAVSGGFSSLAEARNVLDIIKQLGYEGAWLVRADSRD